MAGADQVFKLAQEEDYFGAAKAVNDGLNKDPNNMALLMTYAYVMMRLENWGMAYNILLHVKAHSPQYPEIYNNLGMALASLASSTGKGKYLDEAESMLLKAASKKPGCEIYNNLALVAVHKCDAERAEKFCREALKYNDDHKESRESLGYALLMQGKWEEGFYNFDFALGGTHRKITYGGNAPYYMHHKGVKLYVRGEQGIGDEITYASVLPDVMADNEVTYECDPRLYGLFKRSFPSLEIIPTRFDKKADWMHSREFGAYCLSGSLCREYRKKDEDFPRTPFLTADPERRLQWRTLLDTLPGKKIGIAWTGGLPNTFQSRRSFNLEGLLPILKTPGITWVSLQYKDPGKEIEALKEKHGIEVKHWARATEAQDYDETAALVAELDCVVSVTTAVVHLCGALGKKAYVLVPKKARWFYHSDSPKHRWYDSLELFRQQDKWPIERLADKLKADLWA